MQKTRASEKAVTIDSSRRRLLFGAASAAATAIFPRIALADERLNEKLAEGSMRKRVADEHGRIDRKRAIMFAVSKEFEQMKNEYGVEATARAFKRIMNDSDKQVLLEAVNGKGFTIEKNEVSDELDKQTSAFVKRLFGITTLGVIIGLFVRMSRKKREAEFVEKTRDEIKQARREGDHEYADLAADYLREYGHDPQDPASANKEQKTK